MLLKSTAGDLPDTVDPNVFILAGTTDVLVIARVVSPMVVFPIIFVILFALPAASLTPTRFVVNTFEAL